VTVTTEELRRLARASTATDPGNRARVLGELGDPLADEVIAAALDGLDSSDRNVRVAMLRVLAWYPTPHAAAGIVRGLQDPVRRVREVAAKSARLFTLDPAVVAALRWTVEHEPDSRVRGPAFGALAGAIALPYGPFPDPSLIAYDTLRDLARVDQLRPKVLAAALRAVDLNDDLRGLLEEIVRVGTKAEAVSATRALCGYRVARIDEFPPEEQPRIKTTCARAGGVFYWVSRDVT
jgi:HEAT repeat protein